MLEFFVEFAVAVILVLAAEAVRRWNRRRGRPNRVSDALRRSASLQITLNKLQFAAKSQRAFIAKAKNGGSILQASSPWASTILYESVGTELAPSQEGWVGQPLDGVHRQLLHEANISTQCHIYHRRDLPKSILKSLYETDGVETGAVAIISQTDGKIYYVGLHFTEPLIETAAVEESMRSAVIQFRQLLNVK